MRTAYGRGQPRERAAGSAALRQLKRVGLSAIVTRHARLPGRGPRRDVRLRRGAAVAGSRALAGVSGVVAATGVVRDGAAGCVGHVAAVADPIAAERTLPDLDPALRSAGQARPR